MNKGNEFYENYCIDNLSKKMLLDDPDLAVGLARWNKGFGGHPLAQKMDVLKLGNKEVVRGLAQGSCNNKWGETKAAQDLRVLKLRDGEVAYILGFYSEANGWGRTPAAQDKRVLELCDGGVRKIINLVKSMREALLKNIGVID